MTRSTTHLAVAAECADALMTARRSKNLLFTLLLLFLLAQLTLFLLVRFDVLKLSDRLSVTAATPATLPADASAPDAPVPVVSTPERTATTKATAGEILRYVIPVINFLGIVLSVVLSVVLLLLVSVMLVGRVMGVSQVTSAFIWSVLLAVLLFPWQTFLIARDVPAASPSASAWDAAPAEQPAFKVPGVLYTYAELRADYKFGRNGAIPLTELILKWGRYVGMPVLAMLILLMVQSKSGRGLRFALGESDVQVEVTTRQPNDLTM